MNREIKFRAWDKKNKQILGPSEVGNMMFSYGENYDHITKYDAEIMQYTGLKDKNGKEIYYLDVCRFDNGDTFVVRCEDWLEFYGEWIGEPECEDQLRDWYRSRNSEVIGNILENRELLGEKEHSCQDCEDTGEVEQGEFDDIRTVKCHCVKE